MSAVTTHVLDTALGKPAAGVPVRLEEAAVPAEEGSVTRQLGRATTDEDGRIKEIGPETLSPGTYRLVFDTASYYRGLQSAEPPFFPELTVTFAVQDPPRHYHVPVLLSPYGYSTYRGS